MTQLDARVVADRLREVVADEPKAFAYDIGVSLSAIYNYMNGRIPSTEVLFRISRYSGRPMEWFLEGAEVEVALPGAEVTATQDSPQGVRVAA